VIELFREPEQICSLSRYIEKPVNMGREEWTSVLKLATLWRFGELRQEALDELAQIDIEPVDRIILAREYKVENWLVDGYMELVAQDGILSSKDKTTLATKRRCEFMRSERKPTGAG
jgi:hypothetical protein